MGITTSISDSPLLLVRLLFFGSKHKLDRSKFFHLKPVKQVPRHPSLYKWQLYCRQGNEHLHMILPSSVSPPSEWTWGWLFPEYSSCPHLQLRPPCPIWILRKHWWSLWNFGLIFGGVFLWTTFIYTFIFFLQLEKLLGHLSLMVI